MELTSLEEFAFSLPLYSERLLDAKSPLRVLLAGGGSTRIDGHCPFCEKQSTFSLRASWHFDNINPASKNTLKKTTGFQRIDIMCARFLHHILVYYFILTDTKVVKVGQHPSLADIANDEARSYRSVLSKEDAAELHKAIGLAAHGVGIGSFVYLRRIFERLVAKRFYQFKGENGWNEEDFNKLRMNEKVSFLQDYLPPFLSEHASLYSVLSLGIHELSEEICLEAFDSIKLSMKIILEEDKRKQEELALRKKASEAIAKLAAARDEK
jgi:hypothetical protein